MIYECTDRHGVRVEHRMSDELSAKEAMQRLGVYERPWQVTRWPTGRPDLARLVQHFESPPAKPWVMVDYAGVKVGEVAPIVGHFPDEQAAAEWLARHPDQAKVLRGDFSLDPPESE